MMFCYESRRLITWHGTSSFGGLNDVILTWSAGHPPYDAPQGDEVRACQLQGCALWRACVRTVIFDQNQLEGSQRYATAQSNPGLRAGVIRFVVNRYDDRESTVVHLWGDLG